MKIALKNIFYRPLNNVLKLRLVQTPKNPKNNRKKLVRNFLETKIFYFLDFSRRLLNNSSKRNLSNQEKIWNSFRDIPEKDGFWSTFKKPIVTHTPIRQKVMHNAWYSVTGVLIFIIKISFIFIYEILLLIMISIFLRKHSSYGPLKMYLIYTSYRPQKIIKTTKNDSIFGINSNFQFSFPQKMV